MHISRLELHGFKSFADRTTFHFGPGISCVVGPNGCGKSNVVDALKWVIGEMSARTLRGEDMLDVIFAGSAERKPVGYAEVSLALSAEGGEPFPGELARFAEVQVGRRLYRDGSSEYLLNQTRARRKDIVDLFMDSGVGNHLYSFIEQGRIDKIVSASPEDRRSLVDEAAGITRYKQRREEARQKLEQTCTQLDRAADVVDEMARRLATLEKQVHKAARYRRLRALVRQEEVFLGLVKQRELTRARVRAEAEAAGRSAELVAAVAAVEQAEQDLVLRTAEAEVAFAAWSGARDALAELDAERRAAEATRQAEARRVGDVGRQADAARAEVDAELARRDQADVERREAAASRDALEVARASAVVELDTAATARERSRAAAEAARDLLQAAELESQRARSAAREASLRAELLHRQHGEIPARRDAVVRRREEAEGEAVVLAKRLAVADAAAATHTAELRGLTERVAAAEVGVGDEARRELHARDHVGHAEVELDAAQRAYAEAVGDAEATAGRAEVEVAAAAGAAQQAEDNALRERERADADEVARLEGAQRQAVAALAAEVEREVDAVRRDQEARIEAARQAREREGHDAEADLAGRIEAAGRAAVADVEALEEALRQEIGGQVGALRQRREEAEKAAESAREAAGGADARLSKAQRELADCDGRLAAIAAEEAALASRDAGARAVRGALPDAPRLVDVVGAEEVAPLLAHRLELLVVRTAEEVERAATAAGANAASVVLLRGDAATAGLLGGARVARSLAEAVRGFLERGEPAVVEGTGQRVDPDGVVHLGRPGEDARKALERRERAAELRARREVAEAALQAARHDGTSARAQQEASRVLARKAAEALEAAEREGRERVRREVGALRAEREAATRALELERSRLRQGARAAVEAAVAEARRGRDAAVAEARAAGQRRVDQLRAEHAERVAAVKAASAAVRDGMREEGAGRVARVREEAWERVRRTTTDVQVRREELRVRVDQASEAVRRGRAKAEEARKRLVEARAGVAQLQAAAGEHERVLARVGAEATAAREQSAAVVQRLDGLSKEASRLEEELASLAGQLAAATAAREAADAAATSAEAAQAVARAAWSEASALATRDAAARASAEGRVAEHTASLARVEALIATASARADDARARLETGAARITALEGEATAAAAALRTVEATLEGLSDARQQAAVAADEARQRDERARSARERVGADVHEGSARRDRLQREALGLEQEVLRLRGELTSLAARVEERYQLDLAGLLEHLERASGLVLDAPPEVREPVEIGGKRVDAVGELILRPEMLEDVALVKEFVARIEDHRAELGRVGEVNLGALEEYTELAVRHEELASQRADLEESVAQIRAAIAKMNKTCRERFRETFDRVDEAFRKAYPELVGGGEARLELTDEEDLLETGVEVMVRPPGKRVQSLSLLSGGEKAMTAIALLLALFTVKPSPFCVLDEVDAPLDEANGARFNDMLRRMSSMTQFIVITHNRKTMECADTLYGITMPTPGCSALVSVRVDD